MKQNRWRLVAVIIAGSLLAGGSTARAEDPKPSQPAPQGEGRPGLRDRMKQVAEELKLTDEQKEKLRPIMQEQGEKMKALREDTSLSREDKIAKFKEIMQANAPKIKAILTPEQAEKWEKMREQAQKRRAQHQQQQ